MSTYQRRLETDLKGLRNHVSGMANQVNTALNLTVKAFLAGDKASLYQIVLDDLAINRASRALDTECHRFVAKHLPVAKHLRFVSSILRLNIALERIGDYAVTMCRIGVRLNLPPPPHLSQHLTDLHTQAGQMLEQACKAFLEDNVELAEKTKGTAKAIDTEYDGFFEQLTTDTNNLTALQVVSWLSVLSQVERVSDQAKNICEEAVFVGTGRKKKPKVYKVLFIGDEKLTAPLACSIGQRHWLEQGAFVAKTTNAQTLDMSDVEEAEALGLSLVKPTAFESLQESPAEYHVVVDVRANRTQTIGIPFHTIYLCWDLSEESVAAMVPELRTRIRELMESLRGDEE